MLFRYKYLVITQLVLLTIIAYAQPGKLDSAFGTNGIVTTDSALYFCTAIQTDGKIIVAGATKSGIALGFAVARYDLNGKPDSSFSQDGLQTTDLKDGTAVSIAIQKDEKIVVAGYARRSDSHFDFALARYNIDGSPDSTFSEDGKQLYNIGATYTFGMSVAIQPDGKIVVGGYSSLSIVSGSDFTLARFTVDGSLDKTFSGDGKQTTDFGNGNDDVIYSIAVQPDGKIIAAGYTGDHMHNYFALARYNKDGSLDKTFSGDGKQTTDFGFSANGYAMAMQSDGKIVAAGQVLNKTYDFALARYNTNGEPDNTFGEDGKQITGLGNRAAASSIAIQKDGKIIVGGNVKEGNGRQIRNFALARYNTNGSIDSTFSEDGRQITETTSDDNGISALAISDDKLYAVGSGTSGQFSDYFGVLARYLLVDESPTPPAISLITPPDNAVYLAGGNVYLKAITSDADGTITKVEFYNGATLLSTAIDSPYAFKWQKAKQGNYTLTAKATDNSGLVTTSAPVPVAVVPNKPTAVNIISPANGQTFVAAANINLEAVAQDMDGRVTTVEFYNGSALLTLERKIPYTYAWSNVPAGTYTITARAKDNWGAVTTSEPLILTVISPGEMISGRPAIVNSKIDINDGVTLKLAPNPAKNLLNIYSTGLRNNKQTTVSVTSATGVIIKTVKITGSPQNISLNVSSLVSGAYTLKVMNGDKVIYRRFVKL